MESMENGTVTIEDLARMIQTGFEETAKKKDMEERFEQIDQRFEQVDRNFEQVGKRFEHIDKKFEHIDQRFNGVNRRFDAIDDRLDRIEKLLIADHQKRIEKLEMDVRELKGLIATR